MPERCDKHGPIGHFKECPDCEYEAKTVAAPKTSQRSEVGSNDLMGVGAEATRLIVEGMLSEALRWQAFASANQLSQKVDYYKGRADALDELRRFTKALAPNGTCETKSGAGSPSDQDQVPRVGSGALPTLPTKE